MKILYYECFAGLSGDMNLGAMIDLGVPEDHLREALKKLKIDGYDLIVEKSLKSGISGTKVTVKLHDTDEHHQHRHLSQINRIIDESDLQESIKTTSKAVFLTLGEAEAKIHNKSIEAVHFHEVGAVDAIVDIVGAAICLEYLKPDVVYASEIEVGKGFVKCAHGTFPVPAPATMEILKNIPIKKGTVNGEATTPTGAAILKTIVDEFTPDLNFSPAHTAYGIGHKEFEVPNVVRVTMGYADPNRDTSENVLLLETNVDDLDGETIGYTLQRCMEAGALDAYTVPVYMKKNRPGNILSVLCKSADKKNMQHILFSETRTLGIREQVISRETLRREEVTFRSAFGEVQMKISYLDDQVLGVKPAYDQCAALARKHQLPLQEIQEKIIHAYKNKA